MLGKAVPPHIRSNILTSPSTDLPFLDINRLAVGDGCGDGKAFPTRSHGAQPMEVRVMTFSEPRLQETAVNLL